MQRFSPFLFFFGRGEIHAVKACKDSMMSCWLKVFELSEVLLVTSTEFVISTKSQQEKSQLLVLILFISLVYPSYLNHRTDQIGNRDNLNLNRETSLAASGCDTKVQFQSLGFKRIFLSLIKLFQISFFSNCLKLMAQFTKADLLF